MTQTLYAHINKIKIKKKKEFNAGGLLGSVLMEAGL
jgi:hypothetical protein